VTDQEHIHPEYARQLSRSDKESLFGQHGHVFWMYGLSGAGKSTLANALERHLHEQGRATVILDGDNLRSGLNAGLGFSDAERKENIRRAAEVANLFLRNGHIVIASFICPLRSLRKLARNLIGPADFSEIFIHASFTECARRDVKGLYAKAEAGHIASFTGKDASFEKPDDKEADLIINTETHNIQESLERLTAFVNPRIQPTP